MGVVEGLHDIYFSVVELRLISTSVCVFIFFKLKIQAHKPYYVFKKYIYHKFGGQTDITWVLASPLNHLRFPKLLFSPTLK